MKPIKITKENTNKIAEAIATAEGKAKARTITTEYIFLAVNEVEFHLDLPKKYLRGICAVVDMNSQSFPACYNGRPQSTIFRIERRSTAWYLTSIRRDDTDRSRRFRLFIPKETQEYIQNKALKNAMSF